MQTVELSDPSKIEEFLGKIILTGKGFTTDCLLLDVYDAGLDYPDYLTAEGEDPVTLPPLDVGEEILPEGLEQQLRDGSIRRIVCAGQGTASVAAGNDVVRSESWC